MRELLARFGVQVDGSSFAKAQGALAGLHLALGGLKDIIKPVYDGLRDIVEGTAHAAREATIAAQQTGLTTQEVQGLGYAATQTGLSAEELQHGLIHLARAAQEARNGSAEANLGFFQLGVRAVDAAGNVRPMAALLADVSAKFQAMPDGPKKAALAMQLFSRAGAQLIPLLNKGPGGMAALSVEAGKLGIVMSDKLIAAGAHYAATLERMKASAEGLKYSIASRLFPALERGTQALSAWIAKNREWISLGIAKAFEYVSRVVTSLVNTGREVVGFFTRIWKEGGTAKAVLIGIGLAAAAIIAPLTALAGAIGLIVQDLMSPNSTIIKIANAFGTLFDRIGNWFNREWKLFKKDPLGKLYEWSTTFIDWFAKTLGAALEKALKAAFGAEFIERNEDKFLLGLGIASGNPVLAGQAARNLFGANQSVDPGATQSTGPSTPSEWRALINSMLQGWASDARGGAASLTQAWTNWDPADSQHTLPWAAGSGGGGGGTLTVNAPITVNMSGGDPKAVANEVSRQLGDVCKATLDHMNK